MISSRPALEPMPAITGLLQLFATHPLVALGEVHMLQEEADFVTALLHHPSFPATVQVIVVEFGNARYQSLIDRFIAGEVVATGDLRPVWRDFFGWGFDAPIYEQFFRTVRAINRTLPPAQRLRVLLGDPPVDWSRITQQADIFPWLEQRDAHYSAVIEANILAHGYCGLLIAGVAHFARAWPIPLPPNGTVVHRIERNHPGTVHVIVPHIGFGHETGALEPYLADWPIPSLVSLRTTWLGALDAALVQKGYFGNPDPEGSEHPLFGQGMTLADIADGYLYLGQRSSLTKSTPNPALYRGDEAFLTELHRRHSVGVPFRVEDLLTDGDPRYCTD
jgi:hypothetical protein